MLEDTPFGRNFLFKKATEAMLKARGGHYPAPPRILECVRAGMEGGHAQGSAVEAKRFGELTQTPEARYKYNYIQHGS